MYNHDYLKEKIFENFENSNYGDLNNVVIITIEKLCEIHVSIKDESQRPILKIVFLRPHPVEQLTLEKVFSKSLGHPLFKIHFYKNEIKFFSQISKNYCLDYSISKNILTRTGLSNKIFNYLFNTIDLIIENKNNL